MSERNLSSVVAGCVRAVTRTYEPTQFSFNSNMAVNKVKRSRAPAFSAEEMSVIRRGFVEHNRVLVAKHSNEATQKAKNTILQNIVSEVNSLGVAERGLKGVKEKWQAMRKTVKEKITHAMREKRKQRSLTGGGENPTLDDPDITSILDDDEKDILQVIPPEQIIGVSGGFATDTTDEVTETTQDVDSEVIDDVSSQNSTPSTSEASTTAKRRSSDSLLSSRNKKPRTSILSSSDYYKEMIEIERQKVALMQEELELKKWYMGQKLTLLRENMTGTYDTTSDLSEEQPQQMTSMQTSMEPYGWWPHGTVQHPQGTQDDWQNNM